MTRQIFISICITAFITAIAVYVIGINQNQAGNINGGINKLDDGYNDVNDFTELIDCIDNLTMKIDTLIAAIDNTNMNYVSEIDNDPVSSIEPIIPDNLTTKLDQLITEIKKLTEQRGDNRDLVNMYSNRKSATTRSLNELWNTLEAAKNTLYLKSYYQVLNLLGPPKSMSNDARGGSRVTWTYPDSSIVFIDGYVSEVRSSSFDE